MNLKPFLRTLGLGSFLALSPLPEALESGLERIIGFPSTIIPEAEAKSQKGIREVIQDGYQNTLTTQNGADLETQIQHFITYLRTHGALPATEKTSFYVYDLQKGFVVADINIDEQRMAASLIKPLVMAAAYDTLSHRHVSARKRDILERDVRLSIQHSDNDATNRLIDFVGGPAAVQAYIAKTGLFSETKVVEKIPDQGRTYRNKTSAHDLNILLNQIYHGNIVSRRASRHMLDVLRGYTTSRVGRILGELAGVDGLAGKTGVVYGMNGEATIMFYRNKAGQQRPFIFTALFEDVTRPHSRHRDHGWDKSRSEMIRAVAKLAVGYYQNEMVEQYRQRDVRLQRVEREVAAYRAIPNFLTNTRQRGKAYERDIRDAAHAQDLRYEDLYSLLAVESGFQAGARSPTGPLGIAQLTVAAARDAGLLVGRGIDERKNPRKAIFTAAKILAGHRDYFLREFNSNSFVARDNAVGGYQFGRTGLSRLLNQEREVSYWHLQGNTTENRRYVPRVLAMRRLMFGIQ